MFLHILQALSLNSSIILVVLSNAHKIHILHLHVECNDCMLQALFVAFI